MASLSSFMSSSGGISPGDWIYSLYKRSAPDYLPLNDNTASYLQASYPLLAAALPAQYKIEASITQNTLPTLPASQAWRDITFGNGIWLAISSSTTYGTSVDGVTWTSRTMPAATCVAYGAGLFVTLGSGTTTVYTSPDGINWTTRTAANTFANREIIYAGGLFVGIGFNAGVGYIQTSADGITWTLRTVPNPGGASMNIDRIAYGNGIFIVVDRAYPYGYILTSPDGITWTQRNTGAGYSMVDISYTSQGFMIPIYNSSAYSFSTDGITWTTKSMANILPVDQVSGGDITIIQTTYSGIYITADIDIWTKQLISSAALPWGASSNSTLKYAYNDAGLFIGVASGATNVLYHKAFRISAVIGTTTFYLPTITALTNTYTYVKAT